MTFLHAERLDWHLAITLQESKKIKQNKYGLCYQLFLFMVMNRYLKTTYCWGHSSGLPRHEDTHRPAMPGNSEL